MKILFSLRSLILSFFFLLKLSSCAQDGSSRSQAIEPVISTTTHRLGNKVIKINISRFEPSGNIIYLQLHDNEETSAQAVVELLKEKGGTLVGIENNGERNIVFSVNGKGYEFDPNRVFSDRGIKETLDLFGNYNPRAAAMIKTFANQVLKHLPDTACVVALHNNTEKRYSIHQYKTDKVLRQSAKAVHHNPAMDEDDFFITTDAVLYNRLKERNFSVVLHNNRTAPDDGSLSVYFGKRNRIYVNVEAEYGHLSEQIKMLRVLHEELVHLKN